jgi:hypothetical protein
VAPHDGGDAFGAALAETLQAFGLPIDAAPPFWSAATTLCAQLQPDAARRVVAIGDAAAAAARRRHAGQATAPQHGRLVDLRARRRLGERRGRSGDALSTLDDVADGTVAARSPRPPGRRGSRRGRRPLVLARTADRTVLPDRPVRCSRSAARDLLRAARLRSRLAGPSEEGSILSLFHRRLVVRPAPCCRLRHQQSASPSPGRRPDDPLLLDRQQFFDPSGEADGAASRRRPGRCSASSGPRACICTRMAARPVRAGDASSRSAAACVGSLVGHRLGADVTASDCHPLAAGFRAAPASQRPGADAVPLRRLGGAATRRAQNRTLAAASFTAVSTW